MTKASEQRDNTLSMAVAAEGFEYVGSERVHAFGDDALCVYIDKTPEGVSADDCGRVNEVLGVLLSAEGLLGPKECLQVSSPGLARPLFKLTQYLPFVGKKIQVKLMVSQQERRRCKGVLLAVLDDAINMEVDGETLTIAETNIEKANVCLPDDLSQL